MDASNGLGKELYWDHHQTYGFEVRPVLAIRRWVDVVCALHRSVPESIVVGAEIGGEQEICDYFALRAGFMSYFQAPESNEKD
ncbi:hypothetical protein EMCG_01377 [[Emmonsia] crescens]|uniref:Uncharacterized protein n=1 Tax=[Emmonsia] crescens TaxID=73230 RepID=A0A0G2I2B4_9EURO|nr:hypothetical protein EMCG_01377 [Emmonsia crescens UAMH 3008]